MEVAKIRQEHQGLRSWMPDEILSKMFMGALTTIMQSNVTVQLRLRMMAAELRGNPWPIDPFDPSGKTLRRFERDGQVMGAYTVYEDGVDHGGAKPKDRYFPLYGPLDPPVSTTP